MEAKEMMKSSTAKENNHLRSYADSKQETVSKNDEENQQSDADENQEEESQRIIHYGTKNKPSTEKITRNHNHTNDISTASKYIKSLINGQNSTSSSPTTENSPTLSISTNQPYITVNPSSETNSSKEDCKNNGSHSGRTGRVVRGDQRITSSSIGSNSNSGVDPSEENSEEESESDLSIDSKGKNKRELVLESLSPMESVSPFDDVNSIRSTGRSRFLRSSRNIQSFDNSPIGMTEITPAIQSGASDSSMKIGNFVLKKKNQDFMQKVPSLSSTIASTTLGGSLGTSGLNEWSSFVSALTQERKCELFKKLKDKETAAHKQNDFSKKNDQLNYADSILMSLMSRDRIKTAEALKELSLYNPETLKNSAQSSKSPNTNGMDVEDDEDFSPSSTQSRKRKITRGKSTKRSVTKKQKGRSKTCQRWTEEQDRKLKDMVNKYGARNWKKISLEVGSGFTADQCNQHWHRVLNPSIRKGDWSPEEDRTLVKRVEKFGTKSWTRIAEGVVGRTDIQCRHRYHQKKREYEEDTNPDKEFQLVYSDENTNGIGYILQNRKYLSPNNHESFDESFVANNEDSTQNGKEVPVLLRTGVNNPFQDRNQEGFTTGSPTLQGLSTFFKNQFTSRNPELTIPKDSFIEDVPTTRRTSKGRKRGRNENNNNTNTIQEKIINVTSKKPYIGQSSFSFSQSGKEISYDVVQPLYSLDKIHKGTININKMSISKSLKSYMSYSIEPYLRNELENSKRLNHLFLPSNNTKINEYIRNLILNSIFKTSSKEDEKFYFANLNHNSTSSSPIFTSNLNTSQDIDQVCVNNQSQEEDISPKFKTRSKEELTQQINLLKKKNISYECDSLALALQHFKSIDSSHNCDQNCLQENPISVNLFGKIPPLQIPFIKNEEENSNSLNENVRKITLLGESSCPRLENKNNNIEVVIFKKRTDEQLKEDSEQMLPIDFILSRIQEYPIRSLLTRKKIKQSRLSDRLTPWSESEEETLLNIVYSDIKNNRIIDFDEIYEISYGGFHPQRTPDSLEYHFRFLCFNRYENYDGDVSASDEDMDETKSISNESKKGEEKKRLNKKAKGRKRKSTVDSSDKEKTKKGRKSSKKDPKEPEQKKRRVSVSQKKEKKERKKRTPSKKKKQQDTAMVDNTHLLFAAIDMVSGDPPQEEPSKVKVEDSKGSVTDMSDDSSEISLLAAKNLFMISRSEAESKSNDSKKASTSQRKRSPKQKLSKNKKTSTEDESTNIKENNTESIKTEEENTESVKKSKGKLKMRDEQIQKSIMHSTTIKQETESDITEREEDYQKRTGRSKRKASKWENIKSRLNNYDD